MHEYVSLIIPPHKKKTYAYVKRFYTENIYRILYAKDIAKLFTQT